MKSTGIVRRIDNLGRIVIPRELRRTLGIDNGDPVEIFVEGDSVLLKKYTDNDACVFCGTYNPGIQLLNKRICGACSVAIGSKDHE